MRLGRLLTVVGFVLGAAVLLSTPAAAGGGGGGPCNGFSTGTELVMRDNCFDGVAHFSGGATTLQVVNGGIVPHTYTAVDGSFDTGILQPGESAAIQLSEDGIVRVWCTVHGTVHGGGMAGVLLVGEYPPSLGQAKIALGVSLNGRSDDSLPESE